MGKTLEIVSKNTEGTKKAPRASRTSMLVEDRRAEYLLSGVDECGQRVWFYRVQVSGLHTRLFGPFTRKSDAIDGFDTFLNGTMEVLCECLNDVCGGEQRAMGFIQLPSYMNQNGR